MAEGFWKLWGAVKETSGKIIEVYKEDLQEFTSSITNDTKEAIVHSSEVINSKIQTINKELLESQETEEENGGLNNSLTLLSTKVIGGISNFLEQIPTHTSSPSSFPTVRSTVEGEEEKIVTKDPDNPNFKEWCNNFDITSQTDDISNLISANESLRSLYSSLVPTTVSYSDFWKRYFFHQKEQQEIEARRVALIQKATAILEEEEEIKWDDDDDDDNLVNTNAREDKNEIIENNITIENTISDDANIEDNLEEVNKIQKKNSSPSVSDTNLKIENNEKNILVFTPQLETDTTAQNLSKLAIIDDYIPNNDEGEDEINDIIDSIEDWDSITTDDISNVNEEDWDSWE